MLGYIQVLRFMWPKSWGKQSWTESYMRTNLIKASPRSQNCFVDMTLTELAILQETVRCHAGDSYNVPEKKKKHVIDKRRHIQCKNSKPDYSKTVMGGQKPVCVSSSSSSSSGCVLVYTRDSPDQTRKSWTATSSGSFSFFVAGVPYFWMSLICFEKSYRSIFSTNPKTY